MTREVIHHLSPGNGSVSMTIDKDGAVLFAVEANGVWSKARIPYEHASRLLRNAEQAQSLIRDEYDDEVIP